MKNTDRAIKLYRINLDDARSGQKNVGSGNFIQIVDASSNSALVSISTSQNRSDAYLKFKKNAFLSLDRDFSEFFIRNDAQAGEWVDVLITVNDKEFEYSFPESGVISSIGQIDNAVEVINDGSNKINVDDADTQTAIAALETAVSSINTELRDRDSKRKGLTDLSNCTFVEAYNTSVVITAATNINGMRIANVAISQAASFYGRIRVAGYEINSKNSQYANSQIQTLTDLYVENQEVRIESNSANTPVHMQYELL